MFNIVKSPCDLCSHETVCSIKESYRNFVRDLDKKFKVQNAPEYVDVQINCKYRDIDIRAQGW